MSDELDNAAAAALWKLRLEPREQMGALFRQGEGFGHTNTIGGNDQHVRGSLAVPPGSLAALFHNHPAKGREKPDEWTLRQFSGDDKAQARRLGVPSYITAPDGTVMRFDPNRGATDPVLAEFPIEQVRALYIHQLASSLK